MIHHTVNPRAGAAGDEGVAGFAVLKVTRFVSVSLASGMVTTLPFTQTGPLGWGIIAW
jgi:hypothetical protein